MHVKKMAMRSLPRAKQPLHTLFHNIHLVSSYQTQHPPLPDLINDISRVLSDHRNPHHDLDLSLNPFSSKISSNLVEQVLKRCKNLSFSAHRFFLWAKTIPGLEPSVESHHVLVDILASSRQFAILWDFLTDMKETQSCDITPQMFWIVFRGYSRANLPNDALRGFNRMVEFGVKPSIHDLDNLLYVLCKRKHAKHAQMFFNKVKHEFSPSVKTYSILIRGWGDICELSEARKVFDEMLERKFLVDVLAYNSMLEALCKGGKVDEAYKMFREMGLSGTKPDGFSYSIFVHAYCEANDLHSVFRVLDTMRRYDLSPNVFTYNCVIKRLCRNEKVEEGYQVLDEMMERGVRPDAWSYNAILAYHCDHSEVNMALRLISRMEKDGCMPDRHTYNMVLKLLIRVGRFDRATEVWEGMEKRGFYPSVSTYSVMVHGLCKKKAKLEEACKYFEMMVDEGIPPYSSTVEMLRNRLLGLGFLDTIKILADKMERSTSCSIQELANAMKGGDKPFRRSRSEDSELESE